MKTVETKLALRERREVPIKTWALLGLALCFLLWSVWGTGVPTASLRWTVACLGLGLALWGLTQGTRWQAAGGWTALAFVGQACSLQLWEVGQGSHLQLFYGWENLLRSYLAIFLVALLLQAAIVLWGARRLWPAVKSRLAGVITWPEALVFLVCSGFAAVTVSPSVVQALVKGDFLLMAAGYATKVTLGLIVFSAGTLNLVLAVTAIPEDALEKVVARWRRADRRRSPWWCALWVLVFSAVFSWLVFDRLPHVPDEVAYLFHAKYFAAGRLYLPPPPDPDALSCGLIWVSGDKWYSAQFPGWPAVLAVGVRAGVPWLVNPVLGAMAILLAYTFVRRLYGDSVAEGTVLLLATSPWFLVMSATMMGHPVSLVFTLAALLGVQRARETGSIGAASLAGFCFGALADTRPLEALVVGVVAGLWWLGAGWKQLRLAAVAGATIVGLATVGLQFAYNKALTGDPRVLPFEKMVDYYTYKGANRLGFGRDVGNFGWTHLDPLPGHGPIDIAVNTNQNLFMVNFEMFGWACGSLLFVFLLFVWRHWRDDALMWSILFSIWAGMSFYWFSGGPDFGARYWYQMILPLVVLTVRGAQDFSARWLQAREETPAAGAPHRVWALVALASMLGCVNLLPWRALDKYKDYRGVSGEVRRLAAEYHFGRSLVFVRGEGPRPPWASSEYASAFSLNPLTLDRDTPGPIYARDLGAESRARLRSYYPDRPIWVLETPQATGSGFRVVEGPIPPQTIAPSGSAAQDSPSPR